MTGRKFIAKVTFYALFITVTMLFAYWISCSYVSYLLNYTSIFDWMSLQLSCMISVKISLYPKSWDWPNRTWIKPRVGVTKPISPLTFIFLVYFGIFSDGYLSNIMFIFDRCHCSCQSHLDAIAVSKFWFSLQTNAFLGSSLFYIISWIVM